MQLKTKYLIYIALIHLALSIIALVILQYNEILFVVCEFIIVLSLVLSVKFFDLILRPFRLLNAGTEAISDKDFSMKFLPVGQKELDRLITVYNRMIEQLRMERAQTIEKNFFLEKLIEASPAGIIIMDKTERIQVMNPAASNLLHVKLNKREPLTIHDLPSPWKEEFISLDKSGSSFVQLNGIDQYKCYKSFFTDKGVKQSFFMIEGMSDEILQAEKNSYEKVVRMMSHEVNNSICAVNSIIDSTLSIIQNSRGGKLKEHINGLNIAKERNNHLNQFTKRFADIVKIPPPNVKRCNLKETIHHVLLCFQGQFEQQEIHVNKEFDTDEAWISFDNEQLELVLINIIKNAVEAIDKHGKIEIFYTASSSILRIENNGEPIPPHVGKALFKPFFTTKKNGQGIGLTLIREILTNHGAVFSLKTRPDGITEFRIGF